MSRISPMIVMALVTASMSQSMSYNQHSTFPPSQGKVTMGSPSRISTARGKAKKNRKAGKK